jgi:hypothetical protein
VLRICRRGLWAVVVIVVVFMVVCMCVFVVVGVAIVMTLTMVMRGHIVVVGVKSLVDGGVCKAQG